MKKFVSRLLIVLSVLFVLLACNILNRTENPNFEPQATQPACKHTNDISVPLSSNGCIEVARDSELTISSTDGKAHTCTFKGEQDIFVSIQQGKSSSDPFQLVGDGEYILTCIGSPTSVKIK